MLPFSVRYCTILFISVIFWDSFPMLALAQPQALSNFPLEHKIQPEVAKSTLAPGLEFYPYPKENLASKKSEESVGEPKLFSSIPSEISGVDFLYPIESTHPLRRLYVTGYGGGSISIGDLNGDKKPDLFFVSGPGENRLFVQESQFKFRDVSSSAGIGGNNNWGTGAALADIDNDGDLDIYICNYQSPSQLYINDGKAKFSEQAESFGLNFSGTCMMPSFIDFDRDGFLDLFLLNHQLIRETGHPSDAVSYSGSVPKIKTELSEFYEIAPMGSNKYAVREKGLSDKLYRHPGGKPPYKFIDVSASSGIKDSGMGLSGIWWDYNEDNFPDLYVANDFAAPDHLWVNNGNGTFTDKLADTFPHTTWFSMGGDFSDFNNDGHWDLMVADMAGTTHFKQKLAMGSMNDDRIKQVEGPPPQLMRNALFIGTGTARFLESAYGSSVANTDWTWSVKFADLDNDGWTDLFFTNGMTRDFMNSDLLPKDQKISGRSEWDDFVNSPPRKEQNLAFKNLGNLKFENQSQNWGLDHLGMSYAAAHSDLDQDGDLDLVVMNLDEPVSLYRNNSIDSSAISIRLIGTSSNRQGLGSLVTIEANGTQQKRFHQTVSGFNSNNDSLLNFGLGSAQKISSLTVKWPSGRTQKFTDLPVNGEFRVEESSFDFPNPTPNKDSQPLATANFKDLTGAINSKHQETPYNDFERQQLLPNRHSQLGPGLAWADIDGDKDDDLFVGGAAGSPGEIHINQGKSQFVRSLQPELIRDKASEDLGAVFFDADLDSDLDLYVVSGGVEAKPESGQLQDRLYLNDGKGAFSRAPKGSIPEESSSGGPVSAADFDRDGDLDLFIGGRVVPGKYPSTPISLLLENKSEPGKSLKFENITDNVAAGLSTVGMVNSALWSDTDGDGWLDLVLAIEWGPISIWKNLHGKLSKATAQAGLEQELGWWNGLAGRDLDNDGDIDYVATNFGLNTKYHATKEHPTLIYYGDFRGDGSPEIVEAEFENKILFPIRGKGCSSRAIPSLKQKFNSFQQFAAATLPEIYPESTLRQATQYKATTLNSVVLINNGSGRFEIKELPYLAQISPGFGVIATELTGDTLADIYMVQNFYGPQIETGQMDGGLSLLLQGVGQAEFSPIWPKQSGLIVPGDAKSLGSVDLDHDGRAELAVGVNNSSLKVFRHNSPETTDTLTVRLVGELGNLQGIGSKVELACETGTTQTAEVYAGGSYLSQNSSSLFFGSCKPHGIREIKVRWPDGSTKVVSKPNPSSTYEVSFSK